MNFKNAAIIGGDKRQLFAAKSFCDKGFAVYLAGFDKLRSFGPLNIVDPNTALKKSDFIVLPITGARGENIPVYFSDKEILLKDIPFGLKPVFSGRASSFKEKSRYVFDLLSREDFAVANALPSAEGAVAVAMQNFEGVISGTSCLVVGYGRIGKVLSRMLNSLGASVTVASRSEEKRLQIAAEGNKALCTSEFDSISGFDIVFNTADATVINGDVLSSSDNKVLIIDLASGGGGVDYTCAERLGFTAIHALALPGKYSPKTAGEIITDTILNILKEEYGWKRQP